GPEKLRSRNGMGTGGELRDGAWPENDDRSPNQTDCRPEHIPTIRSNTFNDPQPQQRGTDIHTAISGVSPPCRGGVDLSEQPGKEHQRNDAGRRPHQPDFPSRIQTQKLKQPAISKNAAPTYTIAVLITGTSFDLPCICCRPSGRPCP